MWAEHDEHGIKLKETPSPEDLRKLSLFGWLLGCDDAYDEENLQKWEKAESLSDEEIVELFEEYKGVYLYE